MSSLSVYVMLPLTTSSSRLFVLVLTFASSPPPSVSWVLHLLMPKSLGLVWRKSRHGRRPPLLCCSQTPPSPCHSRLRLNSIGLTPVVFLDHASFNYAYPFITWCFEQSCPETFFRPWSQCGACHSQLIGLILGCRSFASLMRGWLPPHLLPRYRHIILRSSYWSHNLYSIVGKRLLPRLSFTSTLALF